MKGYQIEGVLSMELKQRQQLLKESILKENPNAKFVPQYGVSNSAKPISGGIQTCGPNLANADFNATEYIFSCVLNLPSEIEIYFSLHIESDLGTLFKTLKEMQDRAGEPNPIDGYEFNPTKNNNNVKFGLKKGGRVYLRNKGHWNDLSNDLGKIGRLTGRGVKVDRINIAVYPGSISKDENLLVNEFLVFFEALMGKEKCQIIYPWPINPKEIKPKKESRPQQQNRITDEGDTDTSLSREERTSDGRNAGLELEVDDDPDFIQSPFDPSKIDVITQAKSVDLLLTRFQEGEIELAPDFQRRSNLWSNAWKSSLIESILLRIPIPSLYVSEDSDGDYVVVDGLQRFCAILHFVDVVTLNKNVKEEPLEPLKLSGLQSLHEYDGYTYEELPRILKRRIKETELTLHIIRASTPNEVKFSIFSRINKGGLSLSPQEIRSALYREGAWQKSVEKLVKLPEFLTATNNKIKNERMQDSELILRFMALYSLKIDRIGAENLNDFLNEYVGFRSEKWTQTEWTEVENAFKKSMVYAPKIFGNIAFRKYSEDEKALKPINRGMFESQTVAIAMFAEAELNQLVSKYQYVNEGLKKLQDDNDFSAALLYATGRGSSSNIRLKKLTIMLQGVLNA
jgi:hypothetical protein